MRGTHLPALFFLLITMMRTLNFVSGCTRYCRVIQLGPFSNPNHYTKCTCEADFDEEYCLPIYDSLEVYLRRTGIVIQSIAVAIACNNETTTIRSSDFLHQQRSKEFLDEPTQSSSSLTTTKPSTVTLTPTTAASSATPATAHTPVSMAPTAALKAMPSTPRSAPMRTRSTNIPWHVVFDVEWPYLRFGR